MPWIEDVLFCDGCGAEIQMAPVTRDRGRTYYCCEACADGYECDCALVLDDGRGGERTGAGIDRPDPY